jgi:hypothetical protein
VSSDRKAIVLIMADRGDVSTLADYVLAQAGSVERLAVNQVWPEFFDPEHPVPYDLVVEAWGSAAGLEQLVAAVGARATAHAYQVEELVEWQAAERASQEDGLKMFAALTALPGASAEATRDGWDAHVVLAREIHVNTKTYIRNWVTERSPGAPPYFGFAALFSATAEDARDRFYAEPAEVSQERIRQDVKRFLVSAEKIASVQITHHRQDEGVSR